MNCIVSNLDFELKDSKVTKFFKFSGNTDETVSCFELVCESGFNW